VAGAVGRGGIAKKNEVRERGHREGLPAVSKCNEPVGGPSLPPGRGLGGRNIGPAGPRGAGDAGGNRRQRYAHAGAGARSDGTASHVQAPASHNDAFCSGSLRPVSGKHERVPSLSGTLHAPGVARFTV